MKYRDKNGDLKQIYLPPLNNDTKILWTNSQQTSSFGAQTVELNEEIENYKYYEVVYRVTTGTARYFSTGKIPSGTSTGLNLTLYYNYMRYITEIKGKSCTFADCVYYKTHGDNTTSVSNGTCIPYMIIGWEEMTSSICSVAKVLNGKSTSTENTYSCDYINKIVESGTNANGTYIKYENGDMICHHRAIAQNPNFTADGSMYIATVENLFTFPVPFVGNPDVVCSTANNEDYAFSMVLGVIRDNTGISNIRLLRYKASANQSLYVHYIAMGKWK